MDAVDKEVAMTAGERAADRTEPGGSGEARHGTRTVGVRGLAQVAIVVQDVERAKAFYRDVLGLRHLFDAPPGLVFFDCGGVRLKLSRPESEELDGPSSVLYLDVADIDASHRVLVERGADTIDAPHRIADLGDRELWMTFFRDREGNMLALSSERLKTT